MAGTLPSTVTGWPDLAHFAAAGLGGGAGLGVAVLLVRWLLDWIGARVDKREEAVAARSQGVDKAIAALIDHLQNQINAQGVRLAACEAQLEECREHRANDQREIARLTGLLQGWGEIKQEAAKFRAATSLSAREGANDGTSE